MSTVKNFALFALFSVALVGISGCGLIPVDRLSGNFEGDFTQQDCQELFSNFVGTSSDDYFVQVYCAQQLGSLGQEGFNEMMNDTISGIRNWETDLEKLTDPETFAP
jgi:hypothetical protein